MPGHYSMKQKKMAAMADPKKKLDGKDFSVMRRNKKMKDGKKK
tara:strand:- start:189 stop:317 length:129 start_codon:yes stop_codon:yes gene_type:complete